MQKYFLPGGGLGARGKKGQRKKKEEEEHTDDEEENVEDVDAELFSNNNIPDNLAKQPCPMCNR